MKATRPCEYVCFCPITVPTQEGLAHIILAIDVYSDFVMQTGIEKNTEPETILKHIYLLTEHKDFKHNITKGFTLVLNDFYDLAPRIKTIIEPHGKILFDEEYHRKVCSPVIDSLYRSMKRK